MPIGVAGLVELGPGADYLLIGQRPPNENPPPHPSNHWARPDIIVKMLALATEYRNKYPHLDRLKFNDMSLVIGGIFDLKKDWGSKQHERHRIGRTVDVRIKEIPQHLWDDFIDMADGHGGAAAIHSKNDPVNIHFHIDF